MRSLAVEAWILAVIGAALIVAFGIVAQKQMLGIFGIAALVGLGIRLAGVAGDLLNDWLSRRR